MKTDLLLLFSCLMSFATAETTLWNKYQAAINMPQRSQEETGRKLKAFQDIVGEHPSYLYPYVDLSNLYSLVGNCTMWLNYLQLVVAYSVKEDGEEMRLKSIAMNNIGKVSIFFSLLTLTIILTFFLALLPLSSYDCMNFFQHGQYLTHRRLIAL